MPHTSDLIYGQAGEWHPQGVTTQILSNITYVLVSSKFFPSGSTTSTYSRLQIAPLPSNQSSVTMNTVYMRDLNGTVLQFCACGIATVGNKLYASSANYIYQFDLSDMRYKVGASYSLFFKKKYTNTSTYGSPFNGSLSRVFNPPSVVSAPYVDEVPTSNVLPIAFWGFNAAGDLDLNPVKTMLTRTGDIQGVWVDGRDYVWSVTQKTPRGWLYVETELDGKIPNGYDWARYPEGVSAIPGVTPLLSATEQAAGYEATLFRFNRPVAG